MERFFISYCHTYTDSSLYFSHTRYYRVCSTPLLTVSLVAQRLKRLPGMRETFDPWVRKIPWRRKMATHSSTLAWRIPWREEPGRLQSMGCFTSLHFTQHTTLSKAGLCRFYILYVFVRINESQPPNLSLPPATPLR